MWPLLRNKRDPNSKLGLYVKTDSGTYIPRGYEKVYYIMRLSGESRVAPKEMAWERAWKWDWLGCFVSFCFGSQGVGPGWGFREFELPINIERGSILALLTIFPDVGRKGWGLKALSSQTSKNGVRLYIILVLPMNKLRFYYIMFWIRHDLRSIFLSVI